LRILSLFLLEFLFDVQLKLKVFISWRESFFAKTDLLRSAGVNSKHPSESQMRNNKLNKLLLDAWPVTGPLQVHAVRVLKKRALLRTVLVGQADPILAGVNSRIPILLQQGGIVN
jgi:hypothetical protein